MPAETERKGQVCLCLVQYVYLQLNIFMSHCCVYIYCISIWVYTPYMGNICGLLTLISVGVFLTNVMYSSFACSKCISKIKHLYFSVYVGQCYNSLRSFFRKTSLSLTLVTGWSDCTFSLLCSCTVLKSRIHQSHSV